MENDILQQILQELTEIKQNQLLMQNSFAGMQSDLHVVKTDVSELKGDNIIIKSDISGLKGDMQTVKADVKTIKADVKMLYRLSDAAFADILSLDDRISGIK